MKCRRRVCFGVWTVVALLMASRAYAQLSSNPDKFLGNITTSYSVDYTGVEPFHKLWNQITPENESKWGSIEGSYRGNFNWGGCDNAYNYAKQHHFPFKFHTLVWGSQYPKWMDNLSQSSQYEAVVEWMDAVRQRYPDLTLIDVVNEAIEGHAPAPYKDALGGDGETGYDWIIKAFEMAHERWPDAILIYNDYNTFRWQKSEFIELVQTLRDAGAPIDAYGCQSHDLTDMEANDFKAAMAEMQNAIRLPMYITEYDIGTADDAYQLKRYQEQIPYMWEADYCAGVTLWGYIYGKTWTTDGNSGIIRNGVDRPAMTWLREYMQTAAAANAKSPFPGMVKEASVYIKPSTNHATIDESMDITVRARLRTKTIDHVDLYVNNQLYASMTAAPYSVEFTPDNLGRYDLRAVVTATDGTQYERIGGFRVYEPRLPYLGETVLPGTIEAENFDLGVEGVAYHDTDKVDEGGTHYRSDGGGVDIVTGNGGYAIGYTAKGEWLEYTVNVTQAGTYSYDAYASSGTTGSAFSIGLKDHGNVVPLASVKVSQTANNSWDTYKVFSGTFSTQLPAGRQILRITIDSPYCNIDKIVLRCTSPSGILEIADAEDPLSGAMYNVYGVPVADSYKGIVIVNGRKVVRK